MSSGSYFPPPVKAVEVPKPHGGGTRMLGVPTVADRVAQTVVAMELEKVVEPMFHRSSYGYRPGRSQLDAVEACRRRCFAYSWVLDCDIAGFFDNVPHDLIVKAVEANTDQKWVVVCVKRWLKAPLQHPDGTLEQRDHPEKTRVVYCKDGKRRGEHEYISLGRAGARHRPFGWCVSPARPPNPLCGIPHNGLYVPRTIMLKSARGLLFCPAQHDFSG